MDIAPLLAILDRLPFVDICAGSVDPRHPPCAVVPPGAHVPAIVPEFVQSLGLGGTTHRAVFRRLAPRQGIPPHVDDWIPADSRIRRFHVPLISHPEILMRWPDDRVETHLKPGWLYEVRYNRRHEVVNPTEAARTHLQIDQIGATL